MTTTQHPERRAGQRWRSGHEPPIEFTLAKRLDDTEMGPLTGKLETWESETGRRWYFGPSELPQLTLISDVPAAAPLAADRCKAPEWCGFRDGDASDPRRAVFQASSIMDVKVGAFRDLRYYCSAKCADAFTPPLAAHPAETKSGIELCGFPLGDMKCTKSDGHDGGHGITTPWIKLGKPAPQPAPAKPVWCEWCGYGRCGGMGAFEHLVTCHLSPEYDQRPLPRAAEGPQSSYDIKQAAWMAAQTGTPYTGPERLERPKLAHSSMWADEAEDVR